MSRAIRFKRRYRQFNVGDICTTYDPGVMAAMVAGGRAEWVEEKAITAPSENKSMADRPPVDIKRGPGRPRKDALQSAH